MYPDIFNIILIIKLMFNDFLQLTDHELMIASHLVNPYDITVSWNNIAGLSMVIDEIKQTVIFPVQRKELLRNSTLTKPPKGIIFN